MICPMGLAACPPKQKVMVCFFTLMMEKSKPLKYLFLYNLLSAQESNLIGNKCFAYPFDIITWIYYSNYTYLLLGQNIPLSFLDWVVMEGC